MRFLEKWLLKRPKFKPPKPDPEIELLIDQLRQISLGFYFNMAYMSKEKMISLCDSLLMVLTDLIVTSANDDNLKYRQKIEELKIGLPFLIKDNFEKKVYKEYGFKPPEAE